MHALYTEEEAAALRKRAGRCRLAMLLTAGIGLALCVVLCFLVTTANAGRMQIAVIAVSVLAGWAVILIWALGRQPSHAEGTHMESLLANTEREFHTGYLTPQPQIRHLPRSIQVQTVLLETEDHQQRKLSVLARKCADLPQRNILVRVETARNYIIAWEVAHDEA